MTRIECESASMSDERGEKDEVVFDAVGQQCEKNQMRSLPRERERENLIVFRRRSLFTLSSSPTVNARAHLMAEGGPHLGLSRVFLETSS